MGLLIGLLGVTLAVAGLLVVDRLVPLSLRDSHAAAVGVIYAALYAMFGMEVGSCLPRVEQVHLVPGNGENRS
jgi:hypothetical protein